MKPSGAESDAFVKEKLLLIDQISMEMGNQQDLFKAIQALQKENADLKLKVESFENTQLGNLIEYLLKSMKSSNGINSIIQIIQVSNAGHAKDLAFQLK